MQIFRTKSVEQTLAETEEEGHSLKRNLGWWDLAVMGVAVAVGAGIFSVGAQAAAFHAGPAVIISFIIAGIVMIVYALHHKQTPPPLAEVQALAAKRDAQTTARNAKNNGKRKK